MHKRIGEAYAYAQGACAALEYAVQDYAETISFLKKRAMRAAQAGEEARERAARAEARRVERASGVDERRLKEVLLLARRARQACAIVDARGHMGLCGNEADADFAVPKGDEEDEEKDDNT